MNSRYFTWLKSGLLGTLALLGLNACSDDHFDISPSTAKESLWTQIASNPGLDSLKQILERTTFTLDADLYGVGSKGRHVQRTILARHVEHRRWQPSGGETVRAQPYCTL